MKVQIIILNSKSAKTSLLPNRFIVRIMQFVMNHAAKYFHTENIFQDICNNNYSASYVLWACLALCRIPSNCSTAAGGAANFSGYNGKTSLISQFIKVKIEFI